MSDVTPNHDLPFSDGTDAAESIDDTMQALAERLDGIIVARDAGTLAARPVSSPGSPGVPGRVYRVSSGSALGMVNYDTGTGWVTVRQPDPGLLESRPDATAVPAGTIWTATDTGVLYWSNATTWSVVGVRPGGDIQPSELSAKTPGHEVEDGRSSTTSIVSTSTSIDVLSITIEGDGATPIWLEFYGNNLIPPTGGFAQLELIDMDNSSQPIAAVAAGESSFGAAFMKHEVAAFSGSKTFKVKLKKSTGTGSAVVNSTADGFPKSMFLRATWGEA